MTTPRTGDEAFLRSGTKKAPQPGLKCLSQSISLYYIIDAVLCNSEQQAQKVCDDAGAESCDGMRKDCLGDELAVAEEVKERGVGGKEAAPYHTD